MSVPGPPAPQEDNHIDTPTTSGIPASPGTPTGSANPTGPAASGGRKRNRWHVSSYGDARVCSRPDCDTRLSRYNEQPYCANHDPAEA